MKIWFDTHLSPALAEWIPVRFGVEAVHVRRMSLQSAPDRVLYFAARQDGAIIMTKDSDFVRLHEQYGPPPSIIWLTVGNARKEALRRILDLRLEKALELIRGGESLVEISDPFR